MDPKLTIALISNVVVVKTGVCCFTHETKSEDARRGQIANTAQVYIKMGRNEEEDGAASSD
jgi:hypothetical protein